MLNLGSSFRYGVRAIRRNPAFSIASILTLGLGIGANALVFSVTRAVFLKPLPYTREAELVSITQVDADPALGDYDMTAIDAVHFPEATRTMVKVGGAWPQAFAVTGDGDAQTVEGARLTASMWEVLGAKPIAGRVFSRDEDVESSDVVVIGEGYQRVHFPGGASQALGRTIAIDGVTRRVIGVMPGDFSPVMDRSVLWIPMGLDATRLKDTGTSFIKMVGRMRAGATVADVSAEVQRMGSSLAKEYPISHTGFKGRARPLRAALRSNVAGLSVSMTLAVLFLLILACANITNLMLARVIMRRSELSTRLALGGSRAGILRDQVIEGGVIGVAGGIVGLLIAAATFHPLMAVPGSSDGLLARANVDANVALLTFLVSILIGVTCAAISGTYGIRLVGGRALAGGGRRATVDSADRRMRSALMCAQVALATVLLTGSLAMVATLRKLDRTPVGFHTANITVAPLTLAAARFPDLQRRSAFVASVLDKLRNTAGIQAAGSTSHRFVLGEGLVTAVKTDASPPTDSVGTAVAFRRVTGDYFAALDIPVATGRLFQSTDRDSTLPVVVINQAFAKRFFGNESPLSRRIRRVGNATLPWMTVVGVVPDVRDTGAGVDPGPTMYLPYTQSATGQVTLIVRSSLPRTEVARALRAAVSAVDPMQPVDAVHSMDDLLDATLGQQAFKTIILVSLAVLAIVLACTGVAGVTAFVIAQRTREIGLRMALGSNARGVVTLFMGEAARWIIGGTIAGVALSRLLIMQSTKLLPEVATTGTVIYATATLALIAAGIVSTLVPALRAAHVAPSIAIRADEK